MKSRHAYCIFCDDIRHEMGNKPSLMGVYGGTLNLPEFPAVLPKLCVLAYCETPVQRPFQSLSVRLSKGDTNLSDNSVPGEILERAQNEIVTQDSGEEPIEFITMGLTTVLSPFVIEGESILRVTVIADGEEFIAGKLRIRKS